MQSRLALAMPRPATGTIETHRWNDGITVTFRARVRAYGRQWRIHFGTNHEGWNDDRARVELDVILEKVKRGTWEPPSKRMPERDELDLHETVRVTAYRWWQRRKTELAPTTRLDYQWRLGHLVGQLGDAETAGVDARKVDDARQKLVGQGLSARSVNMVLDLLAQVLDDAVEYKLVDSNSARGKRRRMKVPRSRRSFLESDMVVDLLEEASRVGSKSAGPPALRSARPARRALHRRPADLRTDSRTARPARPPRRAAARRRGEDRGRPPRPRADRISAR